MTILTITPNGKYWKNNPIPSNNQDKLGDKAVPQINNILTIGLMNMKSKPIIPIITKDDTNVNAEYAAIFRTLRNHFEILQTNL